MTLRARRRHVSCHNQRPAGAEIATAITKFEQEYLGRGPQEVRTWIIHDMILVRPRGVLTPAEETLAADPDGHHLVKDVRARLIEGPRPILE